ncbi:MAG: hypothetical protein IKU55_03035 [Clostridia bacterium]|nr:hypothetical protein [Clostridia bacterium]
MKKTVRLLNDICKNTEMGTDGVKMMQRYCKHPSMHAALSHQLDEYDEIYTQASDLLAQYGKSPKKIPAAGKIATHLATTAKAWHGLSTSKIAEMMINGNTMGVIQITRSARKCKGCDDQAATLAETLAQTEERNVDDMKRFL